MVQGIQFLTKKGFNPHNLTNRKRVWEAEQQDATQAAAAVERATTLQRERDDAAILAARGIAPRVGFLYDRPPGLVLPKNEKKLKGGDDDTTCTATQHMAATATTTGPAVTTALTTGPTTTASLTDVRPDDDPATAAFRQLLAGHHHHQEDTEQEQTVDGKAALQAQFTGGVLQGRFVPRAEEDDDEEAAAKHKQKMQQKAPLTALEKAVGRRKGSAATTLDEQIARFPALAHAPRATTAPTTNLQFQPLGCQIRNVQCVRCGQWGHSVGDRECAVTGWNPFAAKTAPAQEQDDGRRGQQSTTTTTTERIRQDGEAVSAVRDLPIRGDTDELNRRDCRRKREDAASISSSISEKKKRKKHKKKKKHRKHRRHRRDDDDSDSIKDDDDDDDKKKRHRKDRRY